MDVGHEPLKWTCRPFDLPRTWPGCRENCVTVERSDELGVCTPISPSASLLRPPCHQPFLRYSISPLRPNLRVRSFVRSYDHLSCFVATGRPYASRWTRTREKSHPRPGKYSALGSCPLDTTNRYSSFDMDLRVQPAAKFSRPTRIANARRLIISEIWEFQTSNVMVRRLWVYRTFSRKGRIRARIFALLRGIDISLI